jgi:hypothetical protein
MILRFMAVLAVTTWGVLGFGGLPVVLSGTIHEGQRVFLVDRTGERWDITQAVSLGFDPDGFQFGIGRKAIRPLDASHLTAKNPVLDGGTRVIGVEKGHAAHAYAVRKLTRHEIANTELADTPIAAAY